MEHIANAAPQFVNYGVKDDSKAPYTRVPESYPQHLPKFLIFAQTGPSVVDDQPESLLQGVERTNLYGAETFREGSKYYNHATLFSNSVNAQGNQGMYVRLLGANYGPKPTIRIFLDLLPTDIDVYQRNADGTIIRNLAGEPTLAVPAATVAGYRAKFVVEYIADLADEAEFGTLTQTVGDQIDGATTSTRYPIMELRHNWYGEAGNFDGIRLWPQIRSKSGQASKILSQLRAFPFGFSTVTKSQSTGTVKAVETIFGEEQITITLKPDSVDPATGIDLYAEARVLEAYRNVDDPRYPMEYGKFGGLYIYQDVIDTVLGLLHTAEASHVSSYHDFTAAATDKYLYNLFGGTTSTGAEYHTLQFVTGGNSVRFSSSTNIFAQGGSDGALTDLAYEAGVKDYMARYADADDELMDDAFHVESHIYDSGVSLETKYALIPFISQRKDTLVALSPFVYGEDKLTASEEWSVAQSLKAAFELFPESTYFGTSVYRGIIMGASGKVRGVKSTKHYPLTHELAVKSARYMGAANGIFKTGESFSGDPGNVVETQYDLSLRWIAPSVRSRFWDAGLNWVGRTDRKTFYIPAFKTIYNEDTSILTSYVTACIFLTVNKSLAKAQRKFSNRDDLTPAQFTQQVNDFLSNDLKGRFEGRVTIIPRAQFTTVDEMLNYSWTVPVDVGGEGMKTVMKGYAVARRRSDLAA